MTSAPLGGSFLVAYPTHYRFTLTPRASKSLRQRYSKPTARPWAILPKLFCCGNHILLATILSCPSPLRSTAHGFLPPTIAETARYEHRDDPTRPCIARSRQLSGNGRTSARRERSYGDVNRTVDPCAGSRRRRFPAHGRRPILRYPAHDWRCSSKPNRRDSDQFHANLIITAAQHRAGERIPRQPVPKNTWLPKLGIALILQAWIIAGLWWLLAG